MKPSLIVALCFVASLAAQPQCILYDEPTTMVDPIMGDHLGDLMLRLKKEMHLTSVVVTHDIQSAFLVGDRIAYLFEGRMLFVGTVAEARTSDEPRLRHFLSGGRGREDATL